jgi:putative transposase
VPGRKRDIAVDTDGRLLVINLTTSDIADSAGAKAILGAIRNRRPCGKRLFVDRAYDRRKLIGKAAFKDFVIEILRRIDAKPACKSYHHAGSSFGPSLG